MDNQIKLNRNEDNKLYLLGAYQIGGGIYGLIISSILIASFSSYPIGKILLAILNISLFAFSIICGYLIVTRRFLKGLNLSIYNNALQVIGFGITGYSFKYVSGFFAGLTLDMVDDTLIGFGFDFSIITLGFGSNSQAIFMTLNIFAIVILAFIFKMRDKIELKIKSQSEANVA